MRESTNRSIDHKIFKNTANKIKEINVNKKINRGGIRL